MSLPEYEHVEQPLLCLIYSSPNHELRASDSYRPLGDHFHLTAAERTEPRKDGRDEPLWNNMVQWARRKLKDSGYLAKAPHDVWRLSERGIAAAKRQCG